MIHWAYEYGGSHGKIAVPKVKSLKVVDIAETLINHYKPTNGWFEGIKEEIMASTWKENYMRRWYLVKSG